MGEKGNAAGFGDATGTASGTAAGTASGRDMLGGSDLKGAAGAVAEARGGEAGESTSEMIGGLVAKTGGEFLAGAALGAATEKLEDRSKRKKAAPGGSAKD